MGKAAGSKAGGGGGGGGGGKSAGGGSSGKVQEYVPTGGAITIKYSDIDSMYNLSGSPRGEFKASIVKNSDGSFQAYLMQNGKQIGTRSFDTTSQAKTFIQQTSSSIGAKMTDR